MKVRIDVETHTHENRPVAKGDVIDVPDDIAKLLIDAKIGTATNSNQSTTAPQGA